MGYIKKILLFLFLTGVFYWLIVFFDTTFFRSEDKNYIEGEYIEKSYEQESAKTDISHITQEEKNISERLLEVQKKKIIEEARKKRQQQEEIQKYFISYFPTEFETSLQLYTENINTLLTSSLEQKIQVLFVELYKKVSDVRGKMKNGKIQLFGVQDIPQGEFIALFIHEFAHYLDLYYFESDYKEDISSKFYEISWESTKVMRSGQTQKDFVSGYAMTNKYEDFAETFTYYTLHNTDFLKKAQKSELLLQKYNFLSVYLYFNTEFQKTNFATSTSVKEYYRDITKIDINVDNFLQYIKK